MSTNRTHTAGRNCAAVSDDRVAKAREVSVVKTWQRLGLPEIGGDGMVSSPWRKDAKPSLQVGGDKNIAFDYGTQEKLDSIDLVRRALDFSFPDAVDYLIGAQHGQRNNVAGGAKVKVKPKESAWIWKTRAIALAAYDLLKPVRDDSAAVEFLNQGYGLLAASIPTDWRVFVHPSRGRGIVYKGAAVDGSPVFKFKTLSRNGEGKRQSCFLFGGDGVLALAGAPGEALVVVGGEEKAAVPWAAGFNVIGLLAGEKALDAELSAYIAATEPAAVIFANDHDQAGRGANEQSAPALEAAGVPADRIRVVEWADDLPEKFDLNDVMKAGGVAAVRKLLAEAAPYVSKLMPCTVSARDMQGRDHINPRQIIAGIRPEGLTVLGARPKKGKSWLELLNALRVAAGGLALGMFPVEQGDVLYLALEDSERRMQSRVQTLMGDAPWPADLHFAYSWPRLDKGGFEALRVWLRQHPRASMIVIDTFTRVRPPKDARGDSYQQDADATAQLQGLALEYHVSIVLILHQRKASSDDPFDTISGTLGMTASADVVSVLTRKPKSPDGELAITGRDIEEQRLALRFDAGRWVCTGEADEDGEADPLESAKLFLRKMLAAGPVESERIYSEGDGQGFKKKALYAAKQSLGIKARKGGFQGSWAWSLPCV